MKKVGILSMQRIVNYGSFLQAYALKRMIEELGFQVEFVDYHIGECIAADSDRENKTERNIKKLFEVMGYKAPISHRISFVIFKRSLKRYLRFLGVSKEMNYNPILDCLVIGSDEVFNCTQKNSNVGYSPELFGGNNNARHLISYAASFGNTTMAKLEKYGKKEEIGSLLGKFDAVSVRDLNSGAIVEQLTGKKPEYHPDPVLVYDFIKNCDLIPKISFKEKYLILYAYSGRVTERESDWITKYAAEKNLKVYSIGGIHKCGDRFINCSPFEIFAYFLNAEEVITDTFHGSIFSIVTHKAFTTIIRNSIGENYGNEEKLTDLLERLELTDRMSTNIEDVRSINSRQIDYERVEAVLSCLRTEAKEYLHDNIY